MSSFMTPLLSLIGIHALIMLFATNQLSLLSQRFIWQWQQYQSLQQRAYEQTKAQRLGTYGGDGHDLDHEYRTRQRAHDSTTYTDGARSIGTASARAFSVATRATVTDGHRPQR